MACTPSLKGEILLIRTSALTTMSHFKDDFEGSIARMSGDRAAIVPNSTLNVAQDTS